MRWMWSVVMQTWKAKARASGARIETYTTRCKYILSTGWINFQLSLRKIMYIFHIYIVYSIDCDLCIIWGLKAIFRSTSWTFSCKKIEIYEYTFLNNKKNELILYRTSWTSFSLTNFSFWFCSKVDLGVSKILLNENLIWEKK